MPAKRQRGRLSQVRTPALRSQVVVRFRQNVDDDLRLATSKLPRAVLSDLAREGLRHMLGLRAVSPAPQIGVAKPAVPLVQREEKKITEADFDRLGEMMGNG